MEEKMPAKSKAQFRFMKGVEAGNIKAEGLSKKEAKEYTRGQKGKKFQKLPNKVKKNGEK
jgi:hypothetical protein